MKKEEIPQDPSALDNVSKELCYAVDESGKYSAELSRGWEVKATALNLAWEDIESRIEEAKKKVISGEVSPIVYFMELRLMDMTIVSSYTGFWKWQIKRHLKPNVFKGLSLSKRQKYCELFEVSAEELDQPFKNPSK
jgi:hypothetical protein